MKINVYSRYMYMSNKYIEGLGQNIMKVWPTVVNVIASNHYCDPADGIFITNILLPYTDAICPSFFPEMIFRIAVNIGKN